MSSRGSVKRDASGRWFFVVDLPASGKRKQVRRRGFATKADALRALDELKHAARSGTYVEPSEQTVAEFVTEWLNTVEPNLRPSTHYSYSRNLRLHVIPHLGDIRLQALDAGTLNNLYARLLKEGNRTRKGGLAPRTVRYIATIIHRALRDAVKWSRLTRNPADAADPPPASQVRQKTPATWTAETVGTFLRRSREAEDRYEALWVLLATTGMRRGEALGLRWADVDLDNGVASISQTLIVVNHDPRFGTPKTKSGVRTVDLDTGSISALREHRARQASERLLVGPGWTDKDLVFCKPTGDPLHPERVTREFVRRVERWELPRLTLHGLRHTWATLALRSGVHPKVVQERLGHANISITMDTYSHVTAGMQRDAAEQVANTIFGAS